MKLTKAQLDTVLYNGRDLNEIVFIILMTLNHISINIYYDVSMILDVLQGINTQKPVNAKLNELQAFGVFNDISVDELQVIIEWLL